MPGKRRQHLLTDGGEHGFIAPCRGGDEVVQRLVQAGHLGWIETAAIGSTLLRSPGSSRPVQ